MTESDGWYCLTTVATQLTVIMKIVMLKKFSAATNNFDAEIDSKYCSIRIDLRTVSCRFSFFFFLLRFHRKTYIILERISNVVRNESI